MEQGRYGPIFPRPPRATASRSSRRSSPAREQTIRAYGKKIEETVAGDCPTPSTCSSSTTCAGCSSTSARTPTSCTRASSTPTSTSTPRTPSRSSRSTGINTVFENLEGFPEDWKTNAAAFVKFVREHQCPSFLEYGEYPYVSADEIKKALRLKAAFSDDARPDAVIDRENCDMLELDDIQHILLTRRRRSAARYEFLSFRDRRRPGGAGSPAILRQVQSAAAAPGLGRARTSAG